MDVDWYLYVVINSVEIEGIGYAWNQQFGQLKVESEKCVEIYLTVVFGVFGGFFRFAKLYMWNGDKYYIT